MDDERIATSGRAAMTGQVLAGRYRLDERVGRGGMGEVYRALDRRLGRTVAVKVLSPDLTQHQEFRRRFHREARTVAALAHPGIAMLHDVAEDDPAGDGETLPFLVMEFVEGHTLVDALARGPLPAERVLAIAAEVLAALSYSHRRGLIHRDIKPSNIMVTPSGAVKVLDFGIAKALAETTTRLTVTGAAIGTPAYLSPEQIQGDPVDGRADLYAVGCLMYELLTGRPPFVADSPFAVMHQHLYREPAAPSTLRGDLPDAVDAVVSRALRKTPAERFPDAAAMLAALPGRTVEPTPRQPPAEPTRDADTFAEARTAVPAPRLAPTIVVEPEPRRLADPAGARRSAWAVRFDPTSDGVLAVLGCVLLWSVGTPDALGAAARYAWILAAVLLLTCARLSALIAWGVLAGSLAVKAPEDPSWTGSDLGSLFTGHFDGTAQRPVQAVAALVLLLVYVRARGRGANGGVVAAGMWLTGLDALRGCRGLGADTRTELLWTVLAVLAALTLLQEMWFRNRAVPTTNG
ncbi:protein kinase domain-containing protein [Embleya hyalina]|uniref:non-specific serine/threonine protein kinase n=1 Tax=Embleya hyalina TaxID=516124 RepID=A0A401YMH5_9ACTN|nr:protein kinase [Embleya hyalina]GCD95812.1 serine/threonine protein kinase [Embleya hyalina]